MEISDAIEEGRRVRLDQGTAHGTVYCHEGRAYIRFTSFVLEGNKRFPVCFEMYEDMVDGSPKGGPLRTDANGNALILTFGFMGPVGRFE